MISYPDALALLLGETGPLDNERAGLDAAHGRILAGDITSPIPLPGFDNAAMDGYAFRATTDITPVGTTFPVAAMHPAGATVEAYGEGQACEIATGARMPRGFDTVVPVERSERDGSTVRFAAAEKRGQNVRLTGSDIEAGAVALTAGHRIDPAAIMLLAAMGIDGIDVVRRPRVAVITTGSELHATGPLPPGGIHDSNGPFLLASLARWGADIVWRARVPDTGDAFHRAVDEARAAKADLILTTGAVSAGRFDFVPAALQSLGARELFHKVAIRPGKPVLATRFDNGPLVMSLPGNPIAVAVGHRFFVAPVLRALAALPPEQPTRVRLTATASARPGLQHFAFGRIGRDGDGQATATILPDQGAFRIVPFTRADVWLTAADAFGERVDSWPLDAADAR